LEIDPSPIVYLVFGLVLIQSRDLIGYIIGANVNKKVILLLLEVVPLPEGEDSKGKLVDWRGYHGHAKHYWVAIKTD
jgi:hypothetical protein